MALQRFFLTPEQFKTEHILIQGEIAHQVQRVLRLSAGAQVLLLDGSGSEYQAELLGYSGGTANFRVLEKRPATGEPSIQITLYQGLLKGEKFDYVLQKGTELGISGFVPVLMERCISDTASPNKIERWRKIIREAAEQSRRGRLPELANSVGSFREVLTTIKADLKIMAWEEESSNTLKQVLSAHLQPQTIAILIGPEGGITPKEAELARNSGFQSVSLGSRILRAETAGPTTAALTLYHYSEL